MNPKSPLFRSSLIRLFGLMLLIGLLVGCSIRHNGRWLSFKNFSHTVSLNGETLDIISFWYTGTVDNRNIIAQRNPGIPNRNLKRGQVVLIPESLLVQRRPLTQTFIGMVQTERRAPSGGGTKKGSTTKLVALPPAPLEPQLEAEENSVQDDGNSEAQAVNTDETDSTEVERAPTANADETINTAELDSNEKVANSDLQAKVTEIENEPDVDVRKREYDKLLESLMETP